MGKHTAAVSASNTWGGKLFLEGTNSNIFSFVGHGASVTAAQVKAAKTMYKQMRLRLTGW